MADEVDVANNVQEVVLSAMIQQSSKKAPVFVNHEQKCLNCGEPVETTAHKFCCHECEEDYRARKEAEIRRSGRRNA